MLACFVMILATISDLFSQLQNHVSIELQRIKIFQTLYQVLKL